MEKKERKTIAIRMNTDLFTKAKQRAISNELNFSAYLEALVLKDLAR